MRENSLLSPAVSRSECDTEWEWKYHVYRVHERRWDILYGRTGRWALDKIIMGSESQEKRIALEESGALDEVSDEDIQRAIEINELISEGLRYDRPDILEDAYHAGLYIATSHHVTEDIEYYYRGERLAGRSLRPSLYHGVDYLDPSPSDEELVEERLENLRRFIDRLTEKHDLPSETYTDADLVAIAQHYRWALSDGAPNIKTWLLDVTSNPFTALLFATYPEKKSHGDTGVVYQFNLNWLNNELSDEAGFRPVVPAGVPRIIRQDATFLEIHPELLNQFVANKIRFEQQSSLVFEDPYLGMTTSRVFPDQDRIQQSLQTERLSPSPRTKDSKSLDFEVVDEPPTSNAAPPFNLFLDTSTYDRLVERIYTGTGRDPSTLNDAQKDKLHYIGRFHAFLQRERPEDRATVPTSINRLEDAVAAFDPERNDSVETALKDAYENNFGADVDVIDMMEKFEDTSEREEIQ